MPVTRFVADIITVNDKLRIPANESLKCVLGGGSEKKIVSIQIKSQSNHQVAQNKSDLFLLYLYMCVYIYIYINISLNHNLYISNLSFC